MSRVLSYITSSIWAMRQQEFDVMTLVAVRKMDALDKIAAEIDTANAPKFDTMAAKRGERLTNTRYVEVREGNIAVIDVNGRLAKRMGFFAEVCEGGTSTENLLKDFQTCLDNPNISSIVFNIDSPGGEAFGINELSQHIFNARGKKPMKAYVSGLGCSGAYWIASACDEIICDKSAFLGSIGVVSVWIDDTKAYAMLGFDKKVVVSSNAPKKRLDLNKAEDMAEFVSELDAMEKGFINTVARNRNKKRTEVISDFNQGGVLCGDDAVKVGMADRTGSFEQVIKELAKESKKRASYGAESEGEFDMSFKENFKSLAASLGFNVTEADKPAEASVGTEAPNASTDVQLQTARESERKATAELERIKTERTSEKKEALKTEAESFALGEIKAGRSFSAEIETLTAAYLQAAADDESYPLATGSRVETLKTMQSKRTPHGLTEEQLSASGSFTALPLETSESAKMDAEIEAQVNEYVGQVQPGALKVVK